MMSFLLSHCCESVYQVSVNASRSNELRSPGAGCGIERIMSTALPALWCNAWLGDVRSGGHHQAGRPLAPLPYAAYQLRAPAGRRLTSSGYAPIPLG